MVKKSTFYDNIFPKNAIQFPNHYSSIQIFFNTLVLPISKRFQAFIRVCDSVWLFLLPIFQTILQTADLP